MFLKKCLRSSKCLASLQLFTTWGKGSNDRTQLLTDFLDIPLVHLLYLWNQSKFLRNVWCFYKDIVFACLQLFFLFIIGWTINISSENCFCALLCMHTPLLNLFARKAQWENQLLSLSDLLWTLLCTCCVVNPVCWRNFSARMLTWLMDSCGCTGIWAPEWHVALPGLLKSLCVSSQKEWRHS